MINMAKKKLKLTGIKILTILVVFALLFQSRPVLAGVYTVNGFESPTFSTGDVNGQDGWTGTATNSVIQNTVYYAGSQALQHKALNAEATKSFSAGDEVSGDGTIISFYHRLSSTSLTSQLYFGGKNTGCTAGNYDFTNYAAVNGNLELWPLNGSVIIKSTYSANTWYLVEIYFDFTNEQVKARVDGGSWSGWSAARSAGNNVDCAHRFGTDVETGSVQAYFDNIVMGTIVPPVASQKPDDGLLLFE